VKNRLRIAALIALILGAVLWQPARSHLRAASLLARFSESDDAPSPSWLGNVMRHPITERDTTIAGTRARMYVPSDGPENAAPGLVLAHGVHWKGIDDPRLQHFARVLAASGLAVVTPQLQELTDYRVDPASIVTIGESAKELAAQRGARSVGVLALSFAGGLALVAASEPAYAPSFQFVATVGAHDDLGRVLSFFVTDEAPRPDGTMFRTHAHDYGTVVLEYSHVEDFFAPADVEVARETLRSVLHEDFAAATEKAKALSPAGAEKMKQVLAHDVHALAPELLAEIDRLRPGFAAVSPSAHVGALNVPTFVLHGAGDTLIPPSEADWIAHDVPSAEMRLELVSHALEHVGLEKTTPLADQLALVHFMSALLDATAP
jgi:pimeloyl-ACP methyl ester carboxylesterase